MGGTNIDKTEDTSQAHLAGTGTMPLRVGDCNNFIIFSKLTECESSTQRRIAKEQKKGGLINERVNLISV